MGSEDSDFINFKLVDDDGFFGLPLEPLHDFNVGLEASDLDSLLDQFEETEKLFQQQLLEDELDSNSENLVVTSSKVVVKEVVGHKVVGSTKMASSKSKSLLNGKNGSTIKRKKGGISLLAKPSKVKVTESRRPKTSWTSSSSRATFVYLQDHDYCPNDYFANLS